MEEENMRKGPWYDEEDERLKVFVEVLGARRWDSIAKVSGLRRSGKSCRLRWLNYLRPCLKQGAMTPEEEQIILKLQERWGNKWAKIARRLPGRTDNEIKNYWRTHLRRNEHIHNSLLPQSTSSSPSYKFSSSETCSSTGHTNKEDITTNITTPEIRSNIDNTTTTTNNNNNYNNDGIFTDKIYNVGAIIINNGYDNYDDNNYQKGVSDYVITNSPYENRLVDWMNMLSEEQSDEYKYIQEGAVEEECCLDDPLKTWCYGDGISAWDFPGITWDI